MGLKQNIVVVNEYTVKSGGEGTRGSSPGNYALNYMARDGAVEALAPALQSSADDYVMKYMLREEAVEAWPDDADAAKRQMAKQEKFAGKAFGKKGNIYLADLSLSDSDVRSLAKDIQQLFDEGHTVLKTVISFSDDYVRDMGILPDGFEHKESGDWAGNVDEARVRSAICAGVEALSKEYDDLHWIGCVQVDASKVHCHLCMVDAGVGSIAPDGNQYGRLTKRMKQTLRRGIHADFERTLEMNQLSQDIQRDHSDVRAFVKRLTNSAIANHGAPQFIVACLPEDKNLWVSTSVSPLMHKANEVTRLYVDGVLQDARSGYAHALEEVYESARDRAEREGAGPEVERRYVREGEERIINACVDSVYQVLKGVPDSELRIHTPMLDVMAADLEELARARGQDPMLEFGLKLRSYSSRLAHHKEKRKENEDLARVWEAQEEAGVVDPASRALYEFYLYEEEYNAMLVSKYLHFLSFLPAPSEYRERLDEWMEMDRRLGVLEDLEKDNDFKAIDDPAEADGYAEIFYQVRAGRLYMRRPELLVQEIERMRDELDDFTKELSHDFADRGLVVNFEHRRAPNVHAGVLYDFDDVKALDLHHLDYDFPYDAEVSRPNIERFVEATERRSALLDDAVSYLESTGQADLIEDLPVDDVTMMRAKAQSILETSSLTGFSEVSEGISRAHPTVEINSELDNTLRNMIRESVQISLAEL